jgi:hypothetical protein
MMKRTLGLWGASLVDAQEVMPPNVSPVVATVAAFRKVRLLIDFILTSNYFSLLYQ